MERDVSILNTLSIPCLQQGKLTEGCGFMFSCKYKILETELLDLGTVSSLIKLSLTSKDQKFY